MKTILLKTILILALISMCCGFPGLLFALEMNRKLSQYVHKSWQIEDGLPQNSINDITQTRDGYIWLATEEGLVRFDGISFTIFDKQNTKELKHNTINTFFVDSSGNFWIGTLDSGLILYKNERFKFFTTQDGLSSDQIKAINEDENGDLFIGTQQNGLNILKNGKFTSYTIKDGLSSNRISCIYKDNQSNIWIGTDSNGIILYKNGEFIIYNSKNGLNSNTVRTIYQDKDNNLWIGTQFGLTLYKDKKFMTQTINNSAFKIEVNVIYQDKAGNLWIGTNGYGLYKYKDGNADIFTKKDSLSSNMILSIFEDKEENLWIGTDGSGLNQYKAGIFTSYTTNEGLSSNIISYIYEDRKQNFWIGTWEKGFNLFNKTKIKTYSKKDNLTSNIIQIIYDDKDDNLWIGTDKGLNLYKEGKLISHPILNEFNYTGVNSIINDNSGSLWIATSFNGLYKYENGHLKQFISKEVFPINMVVNIILDQKGDLWFSTWGYGLISYKDGKFVTYTIKDGLSSNMIYALHSDKDNNLWIGTNAGLNLFKNGEFKLFNSKSGIFDDTAWVILEDNHNNLWMSCNKGVYRLSKTELLDFAEGKIDFIKSISYGVTDGMKSRECNSFSGYKTSDGKMWFGTVKGVVMVDPDNIKINKHQPVVHIEVILADSQRVDSSKAVSFTPDMNRLEFYYTGLNYAAPEKVTFEYMLEGFDKEWVKAGRKRSTYYTNLPAGDYNFKVKACNNDGIWNETGATFSFKKLPYFYQTNLFYFLCVLAIFVFFTGIYILRMKQVMSKQKRLEEFNIKLKLQVEKATQNLLKQKSEIETAHEKLKELDKQKTHFFQNISHELRTPLTLILNPIEEEIKWHKSSKNLETALKNTKRLLKLVNQLLDFQKLSSQKNVLHLEPVDIVDFALSCSGYYSTVCRNNKILFNIYLNNENIKEKPNNELEKIIVKADIDGLEKIFFNLLVNALKFTPENGVIELRLNKIEHRSKQLIKVLVKDTGPGISKEDQNKLFKVFSQVDGNSNIKYQGTGLGLSLTKELTEFMNGQIGVDSQTGKGSSFYFTFPIIDYENGSSKIGNNRFVKENIQKKWHLNEVVSQKNFVENQNEIDFEDIVISKGEKVVLVVEDTSDMRELLKDILEKEDYKVITVSNGEQGFAAAKKIKPDIIISDWMMPIKSGPEMIKEIKADKDLCSIPIILLTAKSDEESRFIGIGTGADGYLGKPFNQDELNSLVRNMLKLKEKETELKQCLIDLNLSQKRLIQQARLASIGNLIDGISHEIGNPLNSTVSGASLLNDLYKKISDYINKSLEKQKDEENILKTLNKMQRALNLVSSGNQRINLLLNNLRTYSITGQNKLEFYNIKENVESCLMLFSKRIEDQNIEVEIDLDDLPEIKCKPGEINQVINNLISNSMDAMPKNGQIQVIGKVSNDKIEISFNDTGIGISKKIMNQIFDPFFTTKDQLQGTGLGLYISHKIVESHNGEIMLKEINNGTCFLIKLPIS